MPLLVASSDMGGNRVFGMALKARDPGMGIEEFLMPSSSSDPQWPLLLLPYRTVCLPDQNVTAGGRDNLLVVDRLEQRKYSEGGLIAGQLWVPNVFGTWNSFRS